MACWFMKMPLELSIGTFMDTTSISKIKSLLEAITFVFSGLILSLTGCDKAAQLASRDITTMRQAFGWKAKDFFDDPQVIACCEAIAANDLDKINRLLDSGVNVNTPGKDGMTLLLWSMPVPVSDDTECFELLLKRGADPNVKLTGDLGTKQRLRPKDSVTTIAAKSQLVTFQLVVEHGSDLSQMDSWGDTLLHMSVGGGSKKEQIQILIDHGVDLDRRNMAGYTPLQEAIARGHYEIAMLLLKKGARYDVYNENKTDRAIHLLLNRFSRFGKSPGYDELLESFIEKGEDIAEVEEDLRRRKSQVVPSAGFWDEERRLMKKRDEQKAKARAEANGD
jgi:ankyrin repeat protein